MITNYSQVVEGNGKTVFQNNMEIQHSFPIGSLVEVVCEYSDQKGLRLFVLEHQRDCDGEPLYTVGMKKDCLSKIKELEEKIFNKEHLETENPTMMWQIYTIQLHTLKGSTIEASETSLKLIDENP